MASGLFTVEEIAMAGGVDVATITRWAQRARCQTLALAYAGRVTPAASTEQTLATDTSTNLKYLISLRDDEAQKETLRLRAAQTLLERQVPCAERAKAPAQHLHLHGEQVDRLKKLLDEETRPTTTGPMPLLRPPAPLTVP